MNDLEKEAYFAQHWGLNCICNDEFIWRSNETFDTVLSIYNGDLSNWYAQLKPLSEISDEDKDICISMLMLEPNEKASFKEGELNYSTFIKCCDTDEISHPMPVYLYQYLQSNGYALPFRNYSVDKLIEMGWLRLK